MAINQEFKDLISEIKFKFRLNQSEIADDLGVKSTYLSDMINGRVPLSENISDKITKLWFSGSDNGNVENSTKPLTIEDLIEANKNLAETVKTQAEIIKNLTNK